MGQQPQAPHVQCSLGAVSSALKQEDRVYCTWGLSDKLIHRDMSCFGEEKLTGSGRFVYLSTFHNCRSYVMSTWSTTADEELESVQGKFHDLF